MGFKNSGDPRSSGNRPVYFPLGVAALVLLAVVALLFWHKSCQNGQETQKQIVVVSTASPTPLPPTAEETRQATLGKLRAEISASRDWGQIETLAREILVLEPEDGLAWSFLGRFYENKGDTAQAQAAYARSVASPTKTYYFCYLQALFHRKQGDLPAAIASIEQARDLKTDSVSMSNLLLIFRIQAGQADAVRSLIRSYEEVDAQSNEDQWLLAASALALHSGDKAKAVRFAERFRNLARPEIYKILISDPFFDSYRTDPELLPMFSLGVLQ